jgi:hypothetical protein
MIGIGKRFLYFKKNKWDNFTTEKQHDGYWIAEKPIFPKMKP